MEKIDLFDDRPNIKPATSLKEAGRKLSEHSGWSQKKNKKIN